MTTYRNVASRHMPTPFQIKTYRIEDNKMNQSLLGTRTSCVLRFFALSLTLLVVSASNLHGQTTTFAQFFEQSGGQDFVFTNNVTSADFNAVSGGSQIFFLYQNIAGLDPSLQGIQSARLFVTTTTTQVATLNAGTVNQPMNQTITVEIIRDTPAPVGDGSKTNLLTAVIAPAGQTPGIIGTSGGNSATLSATTPDHVVTFSSDFLLFGLTTQRNLAFSFSSVTPSILIGGGNFLQDFTAAASGTFASSPPPTVFVTTSADVSISGRVVSEFGLGLRQAAVTLTKEDGTTLKVNTGNLGYFNFDGLDAGESVIVTVQSKRYRFSPRLITLHENVSDLNFQPDF